MIKFQDLWNNHATVADVDGPCLKNGNSAFSNQCAIKVGNALAKCGFDTTKLPGAEHCWHHKKSEGHVLRAEQLANALTKYRLPGFEKAISVTPEDFNDHISGKKGIIFFKDYWQRSVDRAGSPTGDHIDLWNGSRITDWSSWIRIRMNIVIPGVWSDFEKSKKILFWRSLT